MCRLLLKGRTHFWQEYLMKKGPKPDRFIEALICEDCDVDSHFHLRAQRLDIL